MKHTIHKVFWAWDFDKEEAWLNQMAAKGLHLTDVGFCKYTFEEGKPGAYGIRLELLDNVPNHKKSLAYINFIEETGAEYVGSLLRWAYFRKRTEEGGFDLFSDVDSRIAHLSRVLFLIGVIGVMELYCAAFNSIMLCFESSTPLNLFAATLCSGFGALLVYGFTRICKQYRRLKKEKILHE